MVQCGFNTLIPALVLKLNIFALYPVGQLITGSTLANGNGVGTLISEPTFHPTVSATTIHIDDFNTISPGGPFTLNAQGLLKTDDGIYIGVTGSGFLPNTTHVHNILINKTGVAPIQWGEIDTMTTWSFQASGKYQDLEESTFVANIR